MRRHRTLVERRVKERGIDVDDDIDDAGFDDCFGAIVVTGVVFGVLALLEATIAVVVETALGIPL